MKMTAKIRYIWSGSKKEKCTVKGETSIGEVVIWVMNSNFMSEFYYRETLLLLRWETREKLALEKIVKKRGLTQPNSTWSVSN